MKPPPLCPRCASAWLQMKIDVPLVGDFHFNGHRLLTEFARVR